MSDGATADAVAQYEKKAEIALLEHDVPEALKWYAKAQEAARGD